MKVIKQGSKWMKRITCIYCKSELLVEEEDVYLNEFYRLNNGGEDIVDYSGVCSCAVCGTENKFTIPNELKLKLLKEERAKYAK